MKPPNETTMEDRRERTRLVFPAFGLLIAFILCPSAAARAQGGGPPMDEDLQETIEIYMIAKMTRFLELTDEQERTVIPAVEELNASRREMNRRRRLAMMRLHPLVEDGSSAEEEITAVLGELEKLEEEQRAAETRARAVIKESLTPRQLARFLMFQERFRTEMRNRMRRLQADESIPPARRRSP